MVMGVHFCTVDELRREISDNKITKVLSQSVL